MRRARARDQSREVDLHPQTRTCPVCRCRLGERYRKRRFIVRLDEQLDVISHFLECQTPRCRGRGVVYRPEQEGLLAHPVVEADRDITSVRSHYPIPACGCVLNSGGHQK